MFDSSAIHLLHADLSDPVQLRDAVDRGKPQVIIHCAASGLRFPKPDWFQMARFNIHSTLMLFEKSLALPDCHFVYVSTGLLYREQGRPLRESDPVESLHPYARARRLPTS